MQPGGRRTTHRAPHNLLRNNEGLSPFRGDLCRGSLAICSRARGCRVRLTFQLGLLVHCVEFRAAQQQSAFPALTHIPPRPRTNFSIYSFNYADVKRVAILWRLPSLSLSLELPPFTPIILQLSTTVLVLSSHCEIHKVHEFLVPSRTIADIHETRLQIKHVPLIILMNNISKDTSLLGFSLFFSSAENDIIVRSSFILHLSQYFIFSGSLCTIIVDTLLLVGCW